MKLFKENDPKGANKPEKSKEEAQIDILKKIKETKLDNFWQAYDLLNE